MENKENKILSIISIIVLVVDVIFLIGLTFTSIFGGGSFLDTYNSFKITMPAVTKITLCFGPYIYITAILILIAKERLLKQKIITLIINIGAFFIIGVFLSIYIIAIFKPVHDIGAIATTSNIEDVAFDKGMDYLKEGDHDKALIEFNKVIEINPNLGIAYSYRAFLYARKGELVKSLSDYSKAIEISPDNAKAYGNRGVVYYDMKEYDKAWADVHKAESLGFTLNFGFIDALKKASGRDK